MLVHIEAHRYVVFKLARVPGSLVSQEPWLFLNVTVHKSCPLIITKMKRQLQIDTCHCSTSSDNCIFFCTVSNSFLSSFQLSALVVCSSPLSLATLIRCSALSYKKVLVVLYNICFILEENQSVVVQNIVLI